MGGGSVMMPVTRILTFLAQEIWWIFIISSHFLGGCKFEHLNQSMILLFAAFIFRNSNRWHLFRSKECFVAKWERSGSALSQTWNCPRKSCWETSQKKYCPWSEDPHLKLVLLAAKVGALLLPEVVGLDDVRRVDGIAKVVLEHLQVGVENGLKMDAIWSGHWMLTCNWKPWLFIGAEMGLNWSFELGGWGG